MSKKIFKRAGGILSLVLVAALILGLLQAYILRRNDKNQLFVRGFYLEEEDSLDVVLIGASEVYSDWYAARAYQRGGFTSYPFSFESNPVTMWKYELREILKHQHPQILVVEVSGAVYADDKNLYGDGKIRKLSDNMPYSENKRDLVENLGTQNKLSYYLPIIKYHDRWRQADEKRRDSDIRDLPTMKKRGHAVLRGAFSRTELHRTNPEMDLTADHSVKDLNPDAEAALREFIGTCRDSGIEHVLFVEFPRQITSDRTYDRYQRYNRIAEIVREEGADYAEFWSVREEIGLIKNVDYADVDHLNARGAQKFTDYFCDWLMNKYALVPYPQSDKQKAEWEESARYVEAFCAAAEKQIQKDLPQETAQMMYEGVQPLQLVEAEL
ncbi:MAG: hypothetical protein IJH77_06130 [Mogibacterium sp.]|nr:hypothetical protein [Mogibacterium sp.]